jgi:hypothetical protein
MRADLFQDVFLGFAQRHGLYELVLAKARSFGCRNIIKFSDLFMVFSLR